MFSVTVTVHCGGKEILEPEWGDSVLDQPHPCPHCQINHEMNDVQGLSGPEEKSEGGLTKFLSFVE